MNTQKRLRATALSTNRSRGLLDDIFGGGDVGDTLSTAKRVRLRRSSSYRTSGDVGGSDLDFYRVRLDRTSDFSVRLRSRSSNNQPIAVTILDRRGNAISVNGNFLFRNIEPGQIDSLSVSNLPRGDYFIRLQSENGRGEDYDLELSRRLTSGNSGGNSSGDQNIGELESGRRYRYSGTVGGSDIDSYRFEVDNTSRFIATLNNNSDDDIAISILNSSNSVVQTGNGRFLFGNATAADTVTLFAPTLAPGRYRIRIQSDVGSREDYRLALRSTSLDASQLYVG